MAGNNNNKNEEPRTAPKADRWYDLTLGSSFKDPPSSKLHTLRYEFKPASIDKNQPGTLHKNKDNRVTVEFNNNQPGKPKVTFEGSSEDYKDHAVLFFDGESFRLERLHRAVKRLRHVRLPGESAAATTSLGSAAADSGSPPLAKVGKFQPVHKNIPPMPVEVERLEVGDFKSSDAKYRSEKVHNSLSQPKPPVTWPEPKDDDLDEQVDIGNEDVDILNDDDEDNDVGGDSGKTAAENELFTGIDINNIPHQNETDEEIADVDISEDEDKGPNAAEALRAQLNPEGEERNKQTSSSSGSSGSESSGSSSRSGSGTRSSSSDSESSDADSVNSV